MFNSMQKIVNARMKSYKSDFYDYDIPILQNPEEQYYVWIVRTHGTHLIPKSTVAFNDTLHYWIDNSEGREQDVAYYEIDTKNKDIIKISNIEEYIDRCKDEAEFSNMFSVNDDYDMDYDY